MSHLQQIKEKGSRDMKPLYSLLEYMHVLGVIFSVGPYAVFFYLMRVMKQADHGQPTERYALLRYVVWLSKHAGHVLVVSGFLLWWLGGYALLTSWILIPVAILFAGLFFMARAFTPVIQALEEGRGDREAALKKLRRSLYAYLLILLVSLWFMIAKPVLW